MTAISESFTRRWSKKKLPEPSMRHLKVGRSRRGTKGREEIVAQLWTARVKISNYWDRGLWLANVEPVCAPLLAKCIR
jgi:hypothetical protein